MNAHSGARASPASRALLVRRVRQEGRTVTRSADALGISRRTARTLGTRVKRILTDHGSGDLGRSFAAIREQLRVVHKRTRPCRPQTNGKAERFIQTLLGEWAYATAYLPSKARTQALPRWLRHYNGRRPHGSLAGPPPFSRLKPRL